MVDRGKVNIWEKLMEDRRYFSKVCHADSGVLSLVIKAVPGGFEPFPSAWDGRRKGGCCHKGKFMLCFEEEKGEVESSSYFLVVFVSKQSPCPSGIS